MAIWGSKTGKMFLNRIFIHIFRSHLPFISCKTRINHTVYAITKFPRFYANSYYDLLCSAEIAASSAGAVLTIWQNHRCPALGPNAAGYETLVETVRDAFHKGCSIFIDMQPSSNGNAGLCLFSCEILTEEFSDKTVTVTRFSRIFHLVSLVSHKGKII